jgi:cytochrome c oxidase subunit 2
MNWLSNLQYNMGFIEAGSNYTESLIDFYNIICIYLIAIVFLIGYWIWFILNNHQFKKNDILNKYNLNYILRKNKEIRYYINTKLSDRKFNYINLHDIKDYPVLEGTWCVLPLGFISSTAYPSIGLEYGISPDITPLVTLKVLAHQWYWVFEIEAKASAGLFEGNDNFLFFKSDLYKLYIETYGSSEKFYEKLENLDFQILTKTIDINLNNDNPNFFRLLAIDNKIVLPVNTPIKLIITSVDVLHSFAIPALSVKIDAVPGRLSEQVILIERPGLYWGQCSELCGPYHGFMPVVLEVTSYPIFLKNFFFYN